MGQGVLPNLPTVCVKATIPSARSCMKKRKHKQPDALGSGVEHKPSSPRSSTLAKSSKSEGAAADVVDLEGDKTAVEVTAPQDLDNHDDHDSSFAAGEDTAVEIPEGSLEIVAEEDIEATAVDATAVDATAIESVADESVAAESVADESLPEVDGSRLESIIESLLFAADRPLMLSDLKRLLGSRDGKRIAEAMEGLRERRAESGIQLVFVAGGWQLRTHPGNGAWVAKLVAGRPPRLSRAMMETLSIVAYRQPITRPEIDEIRGVDCGPVLHTLLDRSLIRVIGKKEEVGRPILYGTTPEFLKVFSLRDLTDLPTLREFHELAADDRAKVDASSGGPSEAGTDVQPDDPAGRTQVAAAGVAADREDAARGGLLSDVDFEEDDRLIDALDRATEAAGRASRSVTDPDAGEDETTTVSTSPPGSDQASQEVGQKEVGQEVSREVGEH
jgi:segregation and condensation protein B